MTIGKNCAKRFWQKNKQRTLNMTLDDKLARVLADDLRDLMVVSYIVLGNNSVTNRFI